MPLFLLFRITFIVSSLSLGRRLASLLLLDLGQHFFWKLKEVVLVAV